MFYGEVGIKPHTCKGNSLTEQYKDPVSHKLVISLTFTEGKSTW